jgi:hypothetical protein
MRLHNYRLETANGQKVGAKYQDDKRIDEMRKRLIHLYENWNNFFDQQKIVHDILLEPGMMHGDDYSIE